MVPLGPPSLPLSLLLPLGNSTFGVALFIIAAWFVCTECVIVSMLSICTELDGKARGKMMGYVYAGWSMGRFFGAISGALLYEWKVINPVSYAMTGALIIGLMLVIIGFRSFEDSQARYGETRL